MLVPRPLTLAPAIPISILCHWTTPRRNAAGHLSGIVSYRSKRLWLGFPGQEMDRDSGELTARIGDPKGMLS